MKHLIAIAVAVLAIAGAPSAAQTIKAYGPGGPAPAMKDAAQAFEKKTGTKVEITAGPTPKWKDNAKADADLIFSGSEHMMADFIKALEGAIVEPSIQPMYLRPLAILVRPGNPKGINGVESLFKPGIKVLVVNGAGQTGAWEDMAGRTGEIEKVRMLRRNIVFHAGNSAEALEQWSSDPSIDAWIIWNIWQVSNAKLADVVPIEERYAIYRGAGIALTKQGSAKAEVQAFVDFLLSPEGAAIFRRWGWKAGPG
jgi:accessory colonization factor AcfC